MYQEKFLVVRLGKLNKRPGKATQASVRKEVGIADPPLGMAQACSLPVLDSVLT